MTNDTATAVRRLQYRHHATMPADSLGVSEWAIETLLSAAHDCDEPQIITALSRVNPRVRPDVFAREIGVLYVLAEQIAEAGGYVAAGDDDWAAPRAMIVDEYADALRHLAQMIRGAL